MSESEEINAVLQHYKVTVLEEKMARLEKRFETQEKAIEKAGTFVRGVLWLSGLLVTAMTQWDAIKKLFAGVLK